MSSNRNRYNRYLDTVGTETSDEAAADYGKILNALGQSGGGLDIRGAAKSSASIFAPNTASQRGGGLFGSTKEEDSFAITDSSWNGPKNQNNVKHPQNFGQQGGFLGNLFGRESRADSKAYLNVTELIASACEQGNMVVLDFILQIPFKPDFSFKSDCGDNIYHTLAKCGGRSVSANNALLFMLQNNMGLDLLNEENNEGDTPLHVAVETGLYDVVGLMEAKGAVRKTNRAFMIVETVMESDEDVPSRDAPLRDAPSRDAESDSGMVNIRPGSRAEPVPESNDLIEFLRLFQAGQDPTSTVLPETEMIGDERRVENRPRPIVESSRPAIFRPDRSRSDLPFVPIVTDKSARATEGNDIAAIVGAFKTGASSDPELLTENPQFANMVERAVALSDAQDELNGRPRPSANGDGSNQMKLITPGNKVADMNTDNVVDFLVNYMEGNVGQSGGSIYGQASRIVRQSSSKGKQDRGVVQGTRIMRGFSDADEFGRMDVFMQGGAEKSDSDTVLKRIARETESKKDQLHAESLAKVNAILEDLKKDLKDKKDKKTAEVMKLLTNTEDSEYLAKSVKAILYQDVKESKPELSGLDRANETLKSATKANILKALEKKDVIDSIVTHLKTKDEERRRKLSQSEDKSKKSESKPMDNSTVQTSTMEFESSDMSGGDSELDTDEGETEETETDEDGEYEDSEGFEDSDGFEDSEELEDGSESDSEEGEEEEEEDF